MHTARARAARTTSERGAGSDTHPHTHTLTHSHTHSPTHSLADSLLLTHSLTHTHTSLTHTLVRGTHREGASGENILRKRRGVREERRCQAQHPLLLAPPAWGVGDEREWSTQGSPLVTPQVAGEISELGFQTVEWILPNHPPWSRRGPAPAVL